MVVASNSSDKMLILNVYLPYECKNNFDDYCDYLSKIASIIDTYDCLHVVVLDDFNADLTFTTNPFSHRKSKFGQELVDFCESQGCVISNKTFLSNCLNSHSYVSDCSDLYIIFRGN